MPYSTKKALIRECYSVRSQSWMSGLINKLKFFEILGPSTVLFGLLIAPNAFAQAPVEVTLSHEIGTPNEGFILLDFKGNGESSGFQADIVYDDSNMVDIDLTNCLAGNDAFIASCAHPGPPGSVDTSRIRVLLATLSSLSLGDFTGLLEFEFDGTLGDQDVIHFQWDPNSTIIATDPDADVIANDGTITIVDP